MTSIESVFQSLVDHLGSDHEAREGIRTEVRELERVARELVTRLQAIHGVADDRRGAESVPANPHRQLCLDLEATLTNTVRTHFHAIAEKVPQGQYYRFSDLWRFVTQRLCFVVALLVFLETWKLATYEEVADRLGLVGKPSLQGPADADKGSADASVKESVLLDCEVESDKTSPVKDAPDKKIAFHLELEDYLHGLLQLGSELSRYAVNCVTSGDFERPLVIARFLGDLDAGFRLLNLKNDHLRKRFDALKYDLKKCEEVVYDITLRGLAPKGGGVGKGSAAEVAVEDGVVKRDPAEGKPAG